MTTNLDRALNQAAERSRFSIKVIAGYEPVLLPQLQSAWLRKGLKLLGLMWSHIDLGRQVHRWRQQDAVIIRGFCTEFIALTYLASFGFTQNVYILIHHNIQQAAQNPLARWMLYVLHRMGYRIIVNESRDMLQAVGFTARETMRHVSLPHPVIPVAPTVAADPMARKKVGIIGHVRPGKQAAETMQQLLPLQERLHFTLVVGTDDFSHFDEIDWQGAERINTTTQADYLRAIAYCDVVVLNYEKSRYFYRCSGVVADAIGAQTLSLCPNYPMIRHQIMEPTCVGVLYDDQTPLEIALQAALNLSERVEPQTFEAHYIERSAAAMVPILEAAIQPTAVLQSAGKSVGCL